MDRLGQESAMAAAVRSVTVIDSTRLLVLCTSCHYGCLGDHEGMGANRWAPSHDSNVNPVSAEEGRRLSDN